MYGTLHSSDAGSTLQETARSERDGDIAAWMCVGGSVGLCWTVTRTRWSRQSLLLKIQVLPHVSTSSTVVCDKM